MEPDSLNITDDERRALERLAAATGKSPDQILREAISFFAGCYNTFRAAGVDKREPGPVAAAAG